MLIRGNALAIPLKDKSVQTVVTSPPYWGLRDYGTAKWDGGDAECGHKPPPRQPRAERPDAYGFGTRSVLAAQDEGSTTYKIACGKCGATRIDNQLGLESTPEAYVAKMVQVFAEVRRVLRDDGTIWVNLGDSYAASGPAGGAGKQHTNKGSVNVPVRIAPLGLKPKDLVGIPWRVAFALQADGWYLRSDIIWSKPNPMPESVTDRPTKAHEYIFLLSKNERYYFDADAVKEPLACLPHAPGNRKLDESRNDHDQMSKIWGANGLRNIRSVWTIATQPYPEAHFATFPEDLIKPCILAGCPVGGIVLDPFSGSGTTVKVAQDLGRVGVGLELSESYLAMARHRTAQMGFGALLA
jgi:DNA modification methylase